MKTRCCIVGAGPAGMMLAYMLARKGVEVVLLEAQKDFAREFRGDTLHPSIMENLEELGLAEKVLALPHEKARGVKLRIQGQEQDVVSLDILKTKTKYPYITLMPQEDFLDFMAEEARQFKTFKLMMEAPVVGLLKDGERITGVEVKTKQGKEQIQADLVVAADGRFSAVRKLADIPVQKTAPPMDVLWFKLPKEKTDPPIPGVMGHLMPGNLAAQIDRGDYWQFGGILPKGTMEELREQGIASFADRMAKVLPEYYEGRLRALKDWKELGFFKVDFGRVKRWHRPGLLLIGDAAHIMSPVGGVGINYAIQDAVVAANVLAEPLLKGAVTEKHLGEVQRQRMWPTRVVQWVQGMAHKLFIKQALRPDKPLKAPWFARFGWFRRRLASFIAFGFWKVKVRD